MGGSKQGSRLYVNWSGKLGGGDVDDGRATGNESKWGSANGRDQSESYKNSAAPVRDRRGFERRYDNARAVSHHGESDGFTASRRDGEQ